MIDYKSQAVDQILVNCIGLLDTPEKQMKLKNILEVTLYKYDVTLKEEDTQLPATIDDFNVEILKRFLIAKSIQALSKNTLNLYHLRIKNFLLDINKRAIDVTTDDVRYYLAITKNKSNLTNTTMENTRLCLSSFFSWMHNDGYIKRNPMDVINPIKKDTFKEKPFTQEEIEMLIIACKNDRDRAIIEFLLSTGCRASELVSINKNQVDFVSKQLQVVGKGNKERTVYLTDKALVYLKIYLDSRKDDNEALFISCKKPYKRLEVSGLESILNKLGSVAKVSNVHPHRFRRTMCCTLIDRGMNVQDVKEIMGHTKLDTTMIYYNNCSNNIKASFQAVNNI